MKKLLFLFVVLFTLLFSYTIIAQQMGAVRKGVSMNYPEKIQNPLGPPLAAGTYTIGTGGYFPTIDSAFNKLSTDGISGSVTLELLDTFYTAPTDTLGFFLNGPITGANQNSRVTIKPAASKNVTIKGNGRSTISFLNTSYVTVDGVGLTGATTLKIHTLQNGIYPWDDGIDFLNNSDHNIIQNIIFINEDINRGGGGIGFFNISPTSSGADSNLIQNNFIKESGIPIFVAAYDKTVKYMGNIIRGNKIGSENDNLISWGIHVVYSANTIIEDNIVQNVNPYNFNFDIIHGINLYCGTNCIIRNNIVHNIHSSIGFGSAGILLSGIVGEAGVNNLVCNNMVHSISSLSGQADARVAGIQMWQQNNPKVYYNTVYLSGTGTNSLGSAALFMDANCITADVRNNIFVNTRNESPYCASSIRGSSGFYSITSNYNALYCESNQYNYLVRFNSDYLTLVDWQAAGKDANSVTELPHFTAPDLHINWGYTTMIDGHATPISGITTDIDGEPRNALTPDIGADEGVIVPVELTSFTASANGAEVILNWSTATELNNYGFEIQRKALDGEFSTVAFIKGHGTTTQKNEYNFVDKNLDAGKYSYRLKQVDLSGKFEYSSVVEVEVISITSYSLGQNFPNPFNPSTTINYGLKEKSSVKLLLLNALGEEIALLVNEEQDKGHHKVEFDGSKLSSGVYFYQISAGNFIDTKKMILLR